MGLAACSSGVREILLNYSNVPPYLLQCSGPSKPIRLKLYGAYCAVLCWNCAAERISLVLGLPPRGACLLLQEGELPSSAAGTEVTPPTSSAASATVLEDIIDPVDMDSGLTANEAAVLTSDEIMYNPFDRPPGEEVVEVIPRDRSRSPSRS